MGAVQPRNMRVGLTICILLGYIGGSVLARFLKRPDFSSFKITVLVRSPEKAKKLEAHNLLAVVGSHSYVALMESLAADSDVVISTVRVDYCLPKMKGYLD